jgi:hypothetical protein
VSRHPCFVAAYIQVSGTRGNRIQRTIFGFHNKDSKKLKKEIVGANQHGNDYPPEILETECSFLTWRLRVLVNWICVVMSIPIVG